MDKGSSDFRGGNSGLNKMVKKAVFEEKEEFFLGCRMIDPFNQPIQSGAGGFGPRLKAIDTISIVEPFRNPFGTVWQTVSGTVSGTVKEFLDNAILGKSWEEIRVQEFLNPIISDAGNLVQLQKTGVGETTIKKFLGENWSLHKGPGVKGGNHAGEDRAV